MADVGKQTTNKPTKASKGFTDEEKSAMRARAKEQKASASRAEAEQDVLTKIAEMSAADRALAERLHVLITAAVPALSPRTWYGMPAYANQDGKIVCFFQSAEKFKTRYATLGFSDTSHLDDGAMWPVTFALTNLSPAEEEKITALVKRAVG